MITNYLKTAWRNIRKNKAFAAINIAGLTIGISSCLIIYLITSFELSFDTFHKDKDRIYRAVTTFAKSTGENDYLSMVPDPMAERIRSEFTGVEKVVQFHNFYARVTIPAGGTISKTFQAAKEREEPSDIIITEPQYFQIFESKWLAGNAASMEKPFQVVLTESKARKYFGDMPPDQLTGKEIIYADSLRLFVAGIIKDFPENSDLQFHDFISASTIANSFLKNVYDLSNWGNWASKSQTFVKLKEGTQPSQFSKQTVELVKKHMDQGSYAKVYINLQPLRAIHFDASYEDTYGRRSSMTTIYSLIGIAAFILLIAAINFINLSTAQSLQRIKEVGVRKVLGGLKRSIVFQFLTETFVLTGTATILTLGITTVLLKAFRVFIPEAVKLHFTFSNLFFILAIAIGTALIAGLYPAKILSSYTPAVSLKGTGYNQNSSGQFLRKGLIVFQFTISLIFIVATLVVAKQVRYVFTTDMGFSKDAIINIPINPNYPAEKKVLFANALRQLRGIGIVSVAQGTPMDKRIKGTSITNLHANSNSFESQFQTGDSNYVSLYQFNLKAGRNLLPSDTMKEFLVNETCARQLGFKNPTDAVGKFVQVGTSDASEPKLGPIVGILADFHSQSLREKIAPVFVSTSKKFSTVVSAKLLAQHNKSNSMESTLDDIRKKWLEIYPNEKFEYRFFDEAVEKFYDSEKKTAGLTKVSMAIAIFISCMGLLGLATFTASQRKKEIGIRKVLGAKALGIVYLLTKEFSLLVVISCLLAFPIAGWLMNNWLENYQYRTAISWWIYPAAGFFALVIVLLTISFQCIKAANTNPVKSLRSE